MYITLELAKKHLNIEPSYTEDDEYIISIIEVATASVELHINQPISNLRNNSTGEIPSVIIQGILLMVGNLYENRGINSFANPVKLPFNYDYLLAFYKNYSN